MASKKKQSRHQPAKPAEIFYFSEDGECSRTPQWARKAVGDAPQESASAADAEWDLKTPRCLPAPGPALRAKATAPAPSSVAERMNRTERTRATHASSFKGGLAKAHKMEALSREPTDPNAEMPSPNDFMAGDLIEKTESLDLDQMEGGASELEPEEIEEIEEIEPESTLVEEIVDNSEADNVEAEFARALQTESDDLLVTPPPPPPQPHAPAHPRPETVPAPLKATAAAPTSRSDALTEDAALCLLKSVQAQQHYRQKLTPLLSQGSANSPRRSWASAALFGQELFATGRPLPARKIFERLVAQDPSESFPYAMLASLLLALGEDDSALGLYERALSIDSTDLCALLGRAEIHLRAADPVEALVDVQTAINQATLDKSPLLVHAQAMKDAVQKLMGFLS